MNESSNVLNASLLGASSSSAFVFMSATCVCSAQNTARLQLHHNLRGSVTGAGSFSSKLSAVRRLKSSVEVHGSVSGVLTKAVPKSLKVVASATAVATVKASSTHVLYLKATSDVVTDITVVLSTRVAKSLSITKSMIASSTATLRKCTGIRLVANVSMVADLTASCYRGRVLKPQATVYGATIMIKLLESTRIRAPSGRIIYVPYYKHTVYVQEAA